MLTLATALAFSFGIGLGVAFRSITAGLGGSLDSESELVSELELELV